MIVRHQLSCLKSLDTMSLATHELIMSNKIHKEYRFND